MINEGQGVCSPRGYRAAGVGCGIKDPRKSGEVPLDCALVVSDFPAQSAAVFTTNRVRAAAVQVSTSHLAASSERRAVILTSGNANAASGAEFNQDSVDICYGDLRLCHAGLGVDCDESALTRYMRGREIVIRADLHAGSSQAEAYGCALTHAYVDENMGCS